MDNAETILIIEDEAALRRSMRTLLEAIGYQVLEAPDGPGGIAVCAERRPDLVLLDVRMPGMDGFEVCTHLKEDERLRDIPVIFLSGMLEAKEKVRAFRVGAVDYVTKPFHVEDVKARVRVQLELLCQKRRLEAQNQTLQRALEEAGRLNRQLIDMNEQLCRSEALKGHFLSNVRNEINNPLNVLLGLGLELEAGRVPPDRISAVGRLIAGETSGLDFQLQNIFCAAELEAGEATPSVAKVEVTAVVRGALENLRYPSDQAKVRIRLDSEPVEGWTLRTDAAKLRLVVANLVSNAIKFSHQGGEVRVRLCPEGTSLVLVVEDDGVGIRPEDQTRIFERFRQLEMGPTRSYPGKGLGLSVVQALLDLLGGTLLLESDPGRGTRFTCTFPSMEGGDPNLTEGDVLFFGGSEEV
ncbi:hybrid sensor histidine kinase/response regulator [Holophaga foetida]|uniref:hybrid sensor histidine kinase/response regulator n=1 Tax=Holophaga foetida TaxID=35839 RepID=UPI0002471848|nr:hybrid sensor histidine kinase/response regulator [Holophaga foetida]